MNVQKKTLAQQYYEIKNQYLDTIVMIQVGEFYQTYYNDAMILHRELSTKVIGKSIGEGRKIPVCGMPVKWGEYKAKELVKLGYKVLLCNQVRDESEKVVAREVTATFKPKEVFIDISEEWSKYLEAYNESMLDDLVVKKVKATKKVLQETVVSDGVDVVLATDDISSQPVDRGTKISEHKEEKSTIHSPEKLQDMELGYELLLQLRTLDVLNMTPAKMMMVVYGWKESYGKV